MKTRFYLASHDYVSSPQPRLCSLVEVIERLDNSRFVRVIVDEPIPHEPFREDKPIRELLLSPVNAAQGFDDLGRFPVIVDIFVGKPASELSAKSLKHIGTGTIHETLEEAIRFSPVD